MPAAAVVEPHVEVRGTNAAPSLFRLSGRLFVVAVLVLVGIRALALMSALPTEHSERVSAYFTDAERYLDIAQHNGTPYRDFEVEYPPVTLALIEIVGHGDVRDTLRGVGVASFVLDMLALGAVAYGFGNRAALAYLVISTPLFLMPFVYFRVDFLVVALTAWAIATVKRDHDVGGGFLFAAAVFAKLWPIVVLPVVVVERRTRAIVSTVVCGAVGAFAWFAATGTSGFLQVLTFRGARGFQIESVIGGITRLFTGETPRKESGALRVGDVPFAVTFVLGLVMLAGVAWVWWSSYRCADTSDRILYGTASLTAVAIFMACSPLLSPQFILWLVPFGAVAWATGERVMGALVGLAVLVTMLLTQTYAQLNDGLLVGHLMLSLRNGLVLAIVLVGVVRLWRASSARVLQ